MRLLLLLLLTTAAAVAQAPDGTVRVRLFDSASPARATVVAESGPLHVLAGTRRLGAVAPGQSATVERVRDGVAVRFGAVAETAPAVRFEPERGAHLRLRTERRNRAYRGALNVDADGASRSALRLINTVALPDYVASVIPSEYPFPEIEGVKAQAVLVRTYALKSRGKYGDYDVVDHVGSQVYHGLENETPIARRAAEETRGEVLTHGGALIEAVYSSSSGGHTADNDAIWNGRPLPYLRGRRDPYDRAAPDHEWTTNVRRAELHRALGRHFGGTVTGVEVGERTREGRVRTLRLIGSPSRTVPANDVRLAVNRAFGSRLMRSTFFSMQARGEHYHFRGRGFGHGVGMSQHGAREQARQGHGHHDILAFYFADTRIERLDLPTSAPLFADRRPVTVTPLPARPAAERPLPPAATAPSRARPARVGW